MGISSKLLKAKQDAQSDKEKGNTPNTDVLAGEIESSFDLNGNKNIEFKKSNEFGTIKKAFDSAESDKNILSLDIETITFKYSEVIDAVIVKYSGGHTVRYGGMGGTEEKISLLGDSITRIAGVYNVDFCNRMLISNIRVETEKGKKYGPFGTHTRGTAFEICAPGYKINALFGSVDDRYISSLGAYFVKK